VQDALTAHLTAPDGGFDGVLGIGQQAGRVHAGTLDRFNWISSLAFLTAEEASAE
jgi:hypothetical protein